MAWIDVVPFEAAEGVLREVYEHQAEALGRPTELTMVGSLYPELTAMRSELYRVVEECPSTLGPAERQGVALYATAPLGSQFLTSGIESKFLAAGGEAHRAEELIGGDVSGLPEKAAALARYARKVAIDPGAVSESDVEACRDAGATDLDILDANNLAGYYAYLARVCLGLGIE